jgi:hypothetical protein
MYMAVFFPKNFTVTPLHSNSVHLKIKSIHINHFTSLYITSLQLKIKSLHINHANSLHITTVHFTSLHLNSEQNYFTYITSVHSTSLNLFTLNSHLNSLTCNYILTPLVFSASHQYCCKIQFVPSLNFVATFFPPKLLFIFFLSKQCQD